MWTVMLRRCGQRCCAGVDSDVAQMWTAMLRRCGYRCCADVGTDGVQHSRVRVDAGRPPSADSRLFRGTVASTLPVWPVRYIYRSSSPMQMWILWINPVQMWMSILCRCGYQSCADVDRSCAGVALTGEMCCPEKTQDFEMAAASLGWGDRPDVASWSVVDATSVLDWSVVGGTRCGEMRLRCQRHAGSLVVGRMWPPSINP